MASLNILYISYYKMFQENWCLLSYNKPSNTMQQLHAPSKELLGEMPNTIMKNAEL